MPDCIEILSDFEKPYKFGGDPVYQYQINYTTFKVESIQVTDPTKYIKMEACLNPIRLWWVNKKGGWDSFVFAAKHVREVEIANDVIYQDQFAVRAYADRGEVERIINVNSQFLGNKTRMELEGLFTSIQVVRQIGDVFAKVRIPSGAYETANDFVKMKPISFRLYSGELVNIQRQ